MSGSRSEGKPAADVVPYPGPRRPQRCPQCGNSAEARWRPFCSKRCADLDLARWLTEAYRIADDEEPDDDDTAATGDAGGSDGR